MSGHSLAIGLCAAILFISGRIGEKFILKEQFFFVYKTTFSPDFAVEFYFSGYFVSGELWLPPGPWRGQNEESNLRQPETNINF